MRMIFAFVLALALGSPCGAAAADVAAAVPADHGFVVHAVRSEFQPGVTQIFVRRPTRPRAGPLPVLYVLPVEAHDEGRWGDARAEIAALDLAERHGVIAVFPTFAQLPWFADHVADPLVRQERYFLEVVVPFIERAYPARPERRLLLGFSKSGWGAWTLLLRHPDRFAKAAAWDAPMTMDTPRYGMAPIVGTRQNFENYRVTTLLRERGRLLGAEPRLMLAGWDFYRDQTVAARRLLQQFKVPHAYRDGPQRKHHWNSGWMDDLARWVVR